MNWLIELDGAILLWIQENLRHEILTPLLQGITSLGDSGFIWILLTLILLLIPKTRKLGIMSAASLLLSLLINNVCLKNWVARIRPYEVIDGLTLITRTPMDYSFPSGHTASSFCAAVVLWKSSLYYQKTNNPAYCFPYPAGIAVMILAVLISLSRLYVGVHYPTDVLGGLISGVLIGLFVFHISKKVIDKKSQL